MDTMFLEEGMAIEFSINTVFAIDKKYAKGCRADLAYPWIEAHNVYQKLRPSAASIRSLRKESPFIDKVSEKQIEIYLNASPEMASELYRRLPKTR